MKIQTASYREYFPKGTDFSTVGTEMLGKVEEELNKIPRKWLDYQTPAELLELGKKAQPHFTIESAFCSIHSYR